MKLGHIPGPGLWNHVHCLDKVKDTAWPLRVHIVLTDRLTYLKRIRLLPHLFEGAKDDLPVLGVYTFLGGGCGSVGMEADMFQ